MQREETKLTSGMKLTRLENIYVVTIDGRVCNIQTGYITDIPTTTLEELNRHYQGFTVLKENEI